MSRRNAVSCQGRFAGSGPTSIGQLRRDLENLANELMVDITLDD
jgi:hypothetical protein